MINNDTNNEETETFRFPHNGNDIFKLNEFEEEDATAVISLDEETLDTSDPSDQLKENKQESKEYNTNPGESSEINIPGNVLEYTYQGDQFDFEKGYEPEAIPDTADLADNDEEISAYVEETTMIEEEPTVTVADNSRTQEDDIAPVEELTDTATPTTVDDNDDDGNNATVDLVDDDEEISAYVEETTMIEEEPTVTVANSSMIEAIDSTEEEFLQVDEPTVITTETMQNDTADLNVSSEEDNIPLKGITEPTAVTNSFDNDSIVIMNHSVDYDDPNKININIDGKMMSMEEPTDTGQDGIDFKSMVEKIEGSNEAITSMEDLIATDDVETNDDIESNEENVIAQDDDDNLKDGFDVDEMNKVPDSTEEDTVIIKNTAVSKYSTDFSDDVDLGDDVPLINSKSTDNQVNEQTTHLEELQPSHSTTDLEAAVDNNVFDLDGFVAVREDDMNQDSLERTTECIPEDSIYSSDPFDFNSNDETNVEKNQQQSKVTIPSENLPENENTVFTDVMLSLDSISLDNTADSFMEKTPKKDAPDADNVSIDDDFDYNESTFITDYDEAPEEVDDTWVPEAFAMENEITPGDHHGVDAYENQNEAAMNTNHSNDEIDRDLIQMDVTSESRNDCLTDLIESDKDNELQKETMGVVELGVDRIDDEYMNKSIQKDVEEVQNHFDDVGLQPVTRPWTSPMVNTTSQYNDPSRLSLLKEHGANLEWKRERNASTRLILGKTFSESSKKVNLDQVNQIYTRLMAYKERINEKLKALRKDREEEDLKCIRERCSKILSVKETFDLYERLYRTDTLSRKYAKAAMFSCEKETGVLPMSPTRSTYSEYNDDRFW